MIFTKFLLTSLILQWAFLLFSLYSSFIHPSSLTDVISTFTQPFGYPANQSGEQAVTLFPVSLTSCFPTKNQEWNVSIPSKSTGGEPLYAITSFHAKCLDSFSITSLLLSNSWRFSVWFVCVFITQLCLCFLPSDFIKFCYILDPRKSIKTYLTSCPEYSCSVFSSL